MYNIGRINPISTKIPEEIRSKMSPVMFVMTDLLVSLMQSTHRKSQSGAYYAFPSERWIGERLGYCRTHVSECITQMTKLGLIDTLHRRKVNGYWQTNLYRIGYVLAQALKCVSACISSVAHRVGKSLHIDHKPSSTIKKEGIKPLLISKPPPNKDEIMSYINSVGQKLGFVK